MKIHFLTYLNRSGSTVLARMLDEYPMIDVSIEARFIDGIRRGNLVIRNKHDLKQYIDELFNDEKFLSWGIKKSSLFSLLCKEKFPLNFKNILQSTFELYFENSQNLKIYKAGRYYLHVKALKELFLESKFIFIARDPRAIYNSQNRSLDSINNKYMGTNLLKYIAGYKRAVEIITDPIHKHVIHWVKYESLITDSDKTLRQLIDFLELDSTDNRSESKYASKIPEKQLHLHKNIGNKLLVSRIDGWKEELSHKDTYMIQKLLEKEMLLLGYKLMDNIKLPILLEFKCKVKIFEFVVFHWAKLKIKKLLTMNH